MMAPAEFQPPTQLHLRKNGFGDVEVNMSGGYDPTSTAADSALVRAQAAVYKRGIDPIMMPRLAGSWPGYVFTGDPLRLPAGHFGLGHGQIWSAPAESRLCRDVDGALDHLLERNPKRCRRFAPPAHSEFSPASQARLLCVIRSLGLRPSGEPVRGYCALTGNTRHDCYLVLLAPSRSGASKPWLILHCSKENIYELGPW